MGLDVKKDYPLAELTSYKIGGVAEYFFELKDKDKLRDILLWANEKKAKITFFSGGTNILINDAGIKGLVILLNINNIELKGYRISAEAGALLSDIVSLAKSSSLSGLEWAVGIPGSVGGAVRGNAGAFGESIGRIVETIEVFDTNKKEFQILSRNDCKFSYRQSIVKDNKKLIITQVVLKLFPARSSDISKVMESNLNHRLSTQPRLPSAGSVFKNISAAGLEQANKKLFNLAMKTKVIKGSMVSAGWIIAEAGLKGKIIGDAKISLEHGNFIVNTGHAKAEHVIMLVSYIKQQIRNKYDIMLKEEIEYLGFD